MPPPAWGGLSVFLGVVLPKRNRFSCGARPAGNIFLGPGVGESPVPVIDL